MRRIIVLLVAVGMVGVFGGVALAGSSGECSFGTRVNQASMDKNDTSKTIETKDSGRVDADKVVQAQTDQVVKPGPETKK